MKLMILLTFISITLAWYGLKDEDIRNDTAQNVKFSIKDFFSKSDEIRSFLWIWSHLLKKSLIEKFIFVQYDNYLI